LRAVEAPRFSALFTLGSPPPPPSPPSPPPPATQAFVNAPLFFLDALYVHRKVAPQVDSIAKQDKQGLDVFQKFILVVQ
jgi:hypothetical protein